MLIVDKDNNPDKNGHGWQQERVTTDDREESIENRVVVGKYEGVSVDLCDRAAWYSGL